MTQKTKTKKTNIYDLYREILQMPGLSKSKINQMRQNVIRLARAICEYVWGKKFY
jgi:hypothetical protein